jgi:hypothetical protein
MMNFKLTLASAATWLGITLAGAVHANSSNGTNDVVSVGIHDSGHAMITLASSSNAEGCSMRANLKNVVLIPNTNPNFKAMYATALLALSTGRPISGWVNGCTDVWGNGGTLIATATTISISR